MGMVPIPKPGHGFYIASRFYEHGSLADALAGPNCRSLLWYNKRCAVEHTSRRGRLLWI